MKTTRLLALIVALCVPALGAQGPSAAASLQPTDTLRLEVGSPHLDGRVFAPHTARVRVYIGERMTAEWTNELTVGDSAGRQVHRWVTKGQRFPDNGAPINWELRQTYDARTLAPYGYNSTSSTGAFTRLAIDGTRVFGTRRTLADTTIQQVDMTIDRPGYFSGASDIVPTAVGFKPGAVMIAPVWSPGVAQADMRIFTIIEKKPIDVEGAMVDAWKVEERRQADGKLYATWYLTEGSPYMVYGEIPLQNGQVQRMTEVELPR
jgi:hypothetical protein